MTSIKDLQAMPVEAEENEIVGLSTISNYCGGTTKVN